MRSFAPGSVAHSEPMSTVLWTISSLFALAVICGLWFSMYLSKATGHIFKYGDCGRDSNLFTAHHVETPKSSMLVCDKCFKNHYRNSSIPLNDAAKRVAQESK